ncbi:DNA helicase [Virgisporangium aliadipatigenens]|uniref:DNA helicase n=1 Tax=Virgisporangium aliadipatigenens TaxID=741659 RepID=A0A8J3YU22_9ACTN|nr:DEAD/DEAH box helicase [Virgisporangium aliadipatigenens]GIJ51659.1 DNA helicase [Virgisporangium aliadipatigenens]
MTTAQGNPRLTMTLAGSPVRIVVTRYAVTDDQWMEVGLLLAEEQPRPTQPMKVRPETLLARRGGLKGILSRHRIRLEPDPAVRQLLSRTKLDDERALNSLSGSASEVVVSVDQMSTGTLPEGPLTHRLTRDLRPFQQRDLAKLASLSHGANFSVPGAGKTTVTLALHLIARSVGRIQRMLVVAPLSAFGAWEEEATHIVDPPLTIARWRGGAVPRTDIVLINYQRLPTAVDRLSDWMSQQSVHLVIDEAHRAKRGATGGWGRALLDLAPLAERRDILTGTPAPNHPRDLRSLIDILWPGGRVSSRLPRQALQQDPPLNAMAAIADAIRPIFVRTNKRELELPTVLIRPVRVAMGPLQQNIYDAMLSRYAGMFDLDRRDSAMFSQMGEVSMYLLQAASSPRLLSRGTDQTQSYRYPPLAIPSGSRLAALVDSYSDHEVPAKVQRACAIVRDNVNRGEKTLVWSNFPDNLLTLEAQLAALYPAIIYGAVSSDEDAQPGVRTRERELDRFRNDPRCMVLLANPAAMSEGVSLHRVCHNAIYLDRTFNAGQYLQSLDRIHRLGLPPNVVTNVTLLVAEGTIDERVNRRVEEKTRRLSRMLSDPGLVQMALPDDDDFGELVDDPDDLEDILRHLGEAPTGDVATDER